MATPVGAQLDILGDRMIENVYFTYFAVVGMVSLWLPILFFTARGGDRFSARASDEGGAFRLGREWDAANLVGAGAGGVAMEPRAVCGDEMLVFLLFGIGDGLDARAGGADRRAYCACADVDSRGSADADVDDGGILPAAWISGAGGRMEVHRWKCGAGTRHEASSAGGSMRVGKEVEEVKGGKGSRGKERRSRGVFRFGWDAPGVTVVGTEIFPDVAGTGARLRRRTICVARGSGKARSARGQRDLAREQDVLARSRGGSVEKGRLKPALTFFEDGLERVAWHAKQSHTIVMVSGTLEPLANEAARAIEDDLAARGIFPAIRVCATRLEEMDGRWTGRILGEAMFGKAKLRAARRMAAEMKTRSGAVLRIR